MTKLTREQIKAALGYIEQRMERGEADASKPFRESQ